MCNLFQKSKFSKKEQRIHCPCCATSLNIRYEFYQRVHPFKEGHISVQRYRCNTPECPRKTFSVLPYPLLPILRHFYHTLLFCHVSCRKKLSQADGARKMKMHKGTYKRLRVFCDKFFPWFNREKKIAGWSLQSGVVTSCSWADFTRYFSQHFYPNRCRFLLPTEYIPMNY